MDHEKMMQVACEIFAGTARQGPGAYESTAQALAMVPMLNKQQKILDIGCGSGASTAVLWCESEASILAVDLHQQFLDDLQQRIEQEGVGARVETRVGDMAKLDLPEGGFDLIWSEGAIYNMGFESGLRAWKSLLVPGGHIAVSELVWLTDEVPAECRDFFGDEYPAMTNIQGCLNIIESCGYDCVGYFTLPNAAWLENYYPGGEARLPALRAKYADDEEVLAMMDGMVVERQIYEKYSAHYGYVFFVMQRD